MCSVANWTRATLLERLAIELADGDTELVDIIIDQPATVPQIAEMSAADVIERLRNAVVAEAMGRRKR